MVVLFYRQERMSYFECKKYLAGTAQINITREDAPH
jgi:hypothetical protein